MSREATGSLRKRGATWFARVSVGDGQRPELALPFAGEAVCQARLDLLVDVARRLRAAGNAEHATAVLRGLASREGAALEEALRGVEKLCAGRAVKVGAFDATITVEELGRAWTSGKLAAAFPDHIKTKRSVGNDRGRLVSYIYPKLGPIPVVAFTLDDALSAMGELPGDMMPASRRQIAQLLNRLLRMAVFPLRIRTSTPLPEGWMPRISYQRQSDCLYPDDDAKLLASKAPLCFRVFYGTNAREGFRPSEGAALRWRDVDLERGILHLDENKTDQPRSWVMSPGTARALTAWKELRAAKGPEDPVFVDEQGRAIVRWVDIVDDDGDAVPGPDGEPMRRPECTHRAETYRAHLKAAGVDRERLHEDSKVWEPTTLHDLRGLFITTALANGRTEAWVSERTGHTTSQMIERYRRRARSMADATLRLPDLTPLDEAIPELSPTKPIGAVSGGRASKSGSRKNEKHLKTAGFRRVDSNHDSRIQSPLSCL